VIQELSIDIPRLSKALSDETRLRILEFLKQRGPVSYVDLMGALEITNTGRLNYHLKMLGDLIAKDGHDGFYRLSEKGGVALDFLERFQTLTTGIGSTISVGSTPYERTARSLRAILGLEMIAVIVVGVYAYLTFPAQVPLPFEFNGHAYALAPKWVFLVLAALLNIPQLVFLLVSGARYALINRYPFAINIPGFRSNLSQLDYERRGYWVNRLFSAVLMVATIVGFAMISLCVGLYLTVVSGTDLVASSVAVTLLISSVAVAGLLYYLRGYSRDMATETKR
jgi:DNA-binding transcriptional ArsR family regulator